MNSRVWVIARWEWKSTVMRREFLMATFGLPLFFVFMAFLSGLSGVLVATKGKGALAGKPVGIYDAAHVLNPQAFAKPREGRAFQVAKSQKDGQAAVVAGRWKALIVVPPDFVKSGEYALYQPPSEGLFESDSKSGANAVYASALRAGLVWGKLSGPVAARVAAPLASPDAYEWNPKTQTFQQPSLAQTLGKFFIPYVFSLLLVGAIFIGTGYLLHGIVEEKENRVMEVLLSSVTHAQILRGKLIGLGGAGLTQIGVWLIMASIPILLLHKLIPAGLHVPPGTVALAVVLFVLGFGLYGTIMAGIGSLGSSWRESQSITGVITTCAVIPLIFLVPILDAPNGNLARALSWFPMTAPIALMLRTAAGSVPLWDIALSLTSLTFAIWAVQSIAAKIFRLGLLLYGKVPSVPEVWRWIKAS